MNKKQILTLLICLSIIALPCISHGGFLFHATKKAAAEKIVKQGFSAKMMNPKARFGKGVYASKSKSLALREKPSSDAIVVLKDTRALHLRKINPNKMTKEQLKRLCGDFNLRGSMHNGVIGPKLGKKIGKAAANKGKVIVYQSAKGKGYNYFIPKKVYTNNPWIIKPLKILPNGKNVTNYKMKWVEK